MVITMPRNVLRRTMQWYSEKPTLTRIKTNATEFKALHGIPTWNY
jgi:hypothetical protein